MAVWNEAPVAASHAALPDDAGGSAKDQGQVGSAQTRGESEASVTT
jgi:hypothetical protein